MILLLNKLAQGVPHRQLVFDDENRHLTVILAVVSEERLKNEVRLWTFHPMLPYLAPALWMMFLPGLASAQSAVGQLSTPGSIQGVVTDRLAVAMDGDCGHRAGHGRNAR